MSLVEEVESLSRQLNRLRRTVPQARFVCISKSIEKRGFGVAGE